MKPLPTVLVLVALELAAGPAAARSRRHHQTPNEASPPAPVPAAVERSTSRASRTVTGAVYFRNCSEAWRVGAAPIYRGQPGYRTGLDGDLDGIACEPIH